MNIKLLVLRIIGLIPSRLPVGMKEFDTWAGEVLFLAQLPDNATTRGALAASTFHSNGKGFGGYQSKWKVAMGMIKGASNQVCHAKFMELKAIADAEEAERALANTARERAIAAAMKPNDDQPAAVPATEAVDNEPAV